MQSIASLSVFVEITIKNLGTSFSLKKNNKRSLENVAIRPNGNNLYNNRPLHPQLRGIQRALAYSVSSFSILLLFIVVLLINNNTKQ